MWRLYKKFKWRRKRWIHRKKIKESVIKENKTIKIDADNFYKINKESKSGIHLGIDKERFIRFLEENKEVIKNNNKLKEYKEQTIIAHIFNPYGVGDWLISNFKKYGDDVILHGFANLGIDLDAEFGDISLNELLEVGVKRGLPRLPLELETNSFAFGKRYIDIVKDNKRSYGLNNFISEDDINNISSDNIYNIELRQDYDTCLKKLKNQVDILIEHYNNFDEEIESEFEESINYYKNKLYNEEDEQKLDNVINKYIKTKLKQSTKKELENDIKNNTEREVLLSKDFVTEEENNENNFPLKQKFEDNINAIKTLKLIESENREATKEEQKILSKYVGWGGLANYGFDEIRSKKENYDLLKEILTTDEYKDAKASTTSAYYTPDYIVKAIYNKIKDFGFTGGKILEPSCGTGKFLSNMPKDIRKNSEVVGIEKDSISARISKLLYPSMTIKCKGFEKEKIKNNTYNLIIGNIPFGEIKLHDSEYNKDNLLIHDYFINKSLDKLADGGICAIITSTGTLDKKEDKARSLFSEKANFLGAIRLPVGTFGDAKATTDILFFQKDTKNKLGLNQEFVKAEGLYNADKDLIKQKNNIFKNTITKETYTVEQSVDPMQIMSKEMWEDLFVGKTCGGDEPFKKDDYETSYIQVSNDKFAELKDKYDLWVKYGKKPNEKPTYDDTKDLYVFQNNAYLEEVKGLKQIAKYEINVGVENPEYYQIKELKSGFSIQRDKNTEKYLYSKKPLINLETTSDIISNNAYKKQFFDININTYYKNNINNIIGTLQTDTGQYGRPIIVSKVADATLIRNELEAKLKDIHCVYSEPKAEKLEKDTALTYISENEYETNKLYELKKFSHFIFKDKICFKEGDTAYYVNNLNTKKYEQLKALIKLKETTHKILQNEEIGNLDEANSLREVLRDTYNDFYNKYNERINSKNVKSLIAEDDDKGLLLSLEVGNDVEIETYKTKKNAIKKEIPEEEIVEQRTLDNGVEVVGIEDEKGKTRYFDKENNEWIIDTKTEFVLSITENNPDGLAQIFKEPLIKVRPELLSVDNAKDGLILSLQTLGKVDIDFIVEKSNLTKEQVINDLKGQIYYDHIQKDYVSKDEFLSGNIIQKIELYEDLKNYLIKENTIYQEKLEEAESLKSIDNEEEIKDLSLKIAENNRLIETFEPNINDLKTIIPNYF